MPYIQECRDIIVSLNFEILEKPWKSIKVTLFPITACFSVPILFWKKYLILKIPI